MSLPHWALKNLSRAQRQSPPGIVKSLTQSAELTCSHSISSYDTILWYQQSGGMGPLKLIGYVFSNSEPPPFSESKYKMIRLAVLNSSLEIKNLDPGDSAVYFCASSMAH
uniref:Ig-like domain-containing protein n=1 Tax=Scleropages formosus TaxID=113540 RepID=A0A8D0C7X2_SCLFO